MTVPGKCPKCGEPIQTVNAHTVAIRLGTKHIEGITYKCVNLSCQAVLGCQVDPRFMRDETVAAVLRALAR